MKILSVEDKPFYTLDYRSSGRGGQERPVTLPFYKAKVDELPGGLSAFVAVSDLQGREKDPAKNRLVGEAVAEELRLLQELNEIPQVGLILLAGDLFDYPMCNKLGGTGDVTSVWNEFAQSAETVAGVHGNHDIVQDAELLPNTKVLDGVVESICNIQIGGVCGIVGRTDRNQRKSESEYQLALKRALKDKTDILLLHQGPDDPSHNQIGAPFIREALENAGSSLVIFGHCHWDIPLVNIGNHQVLNVDNRLYLFHV